MVVTRRNVWQRMDVQMTHTSAEVCMMRGQEEFSEILHLCNYVQGYNIAKNLQSQSWELKGHTSRYAKITSSAHSIVFTETKIFCRIFAQKSIRFDVYLSLSHVYQNRIGKLWRLPMQQDVSLDMSSSQMNMHLTNNWQSSLPPIYASPEIIIV